MRKPLSRDRLLKLYMEQDFWHRKVSCHSYRFPLKNTQADFGKIFQEYLFQSMAEEQYFTGKIPQTIRVRCAVPVHSQPASAGKRTLGICTAEGIFRDLQVDELGVIPDRLQGFSIDTSKIDRLVWIFSQAGAYFLKSCYKKICSNSNIPEV